MNINRETDISVDLQVGPTSLGMVRLYFSSHKIKVPLDFSPEEAEEIAEEIRSAAEKARNIDVGLAL